MASISLVKGVSYAKDAQPPRISLLAYIRRGYRSPLDIFTKASREIGDITRFKFLFWNVYLLTRPDHIKYVLQENNTNYTKDMVSYRVLKSVLGEGLLTETGPNWLTHRRMMQPAFHHQKIELLANTMIVNIEDMLAEWDDKHTSLPVNIGEEMGNLTLRIIGKVLFSVDFKESSSNLGDAVTNGNQFLGSLLYRPVTLLKMALFPHLKNFHDRKYAKALQSMNSSAIQMIKERLTKKIRPMISFPSL